MRPLMREVEQLLSEAGTCPDPKKVAGTCREILKLRDSLWTFAYVDGVEPSYSATTRHLSVAEAQAPELSGPL